MSFLRVIQLVILFVLVAALSVGLQLSFRVFSQSPVPPEQASEATEDSGTMPEASSTVQPTLPEPEPQPEPELKPHRVALTFDDGPYDKVTPRLLDGLRERGVKVTFFVLGSRLKGREHILARAAEEGHQIANHSYSHSNFTKLSADEIAREIGNTADEAEAACGQRPWLVRPPYGAVNKKVKEAVSEPFIMWSVDPEDWKYRDAQTVYNTVMESVEDGDIILLHDAYESSMEAALLIIDALSERGYDFVTVEELFAESGIELEGGRSYFSAPARTKEQPTEPTQPEGDPAEGGDPPAGEEGIPAGPATAPPTRPKPTAPPTQPPTEAQTEAWTEAPTDPIDPIDPADPIESAELWVPEETPTDPPTGEGAEAGVPPAPTEPLAETEPPSTEEAAPAAA